VDTSFSKRDFSIPIFDTLGAVSSIPLDQNSFETMEILRNNMTRWREAITTGRCGKATSPKHTKQQDTSDASPACAAQTYLIELDFDILQDESERNHLKHLPTSFHLEPSDVDRLKAAAKMILMNSVEFKNLVDDMQ
jgi:NTE family protein